ncbi:MAG TPA: hypothetical protein VGJ04_07040, partial [Pirellulales bacterium]
MKYLAFNKDTATWLIDDSKNREAFEDDLELVLTLPQLRAGVLSVGPLRIAASSTERVVAIWNTDYLSGTGDENWGFIRVDPEPGLMSEEEIFREVFERCLYVISQRLLGLKISSAYFHRTSPKNGAHTCLAGRGEKARQFSIGYCELDASSDAVGRRGLICVGPYRDIPKLTEIAAQERPHLSY